MAETLIPYRQGLHLLLLLALSPSFDCCQPSHQLSVLTKEQEMKSHRLSAWEPCYMVLLSKGGSESQLRAAAGCVLPPPS
jgi:hypothetical protein